MKKFICIAALAAFAAVAEDKPAMPKPAEELKVEKWFVGTWSCKGKRNAGPMGPPGDVAVKLTMKMELAGSWLNVEVASTQGPMKGEVSEGYATWDPASKTHLRFAFNAGGSWSRLATPGWDGDKIVFDGELMAGGQKVPLRHTITRKGDNEFQSVWESAGRTLEDGSCTRAAAKKK